MSAAANARLIAAAPDLLAALTYLAKEVKGSWSLAEPSIREAIGNTNYNCVQMRVENAFAAIAKATGAA